MSINATVDSTTYEGIQTIVVGGKTISLTEVSDEPSGFGYASGEVVMEEDMTVFDVTGLSFTPKAFGVQLIDHIDSGENHSSGGFSLNDSGACFRSNSGGTSSFNGFLKAPNSQNLTGGLMSCTVSTALNTTTMQLTQRSADGFRITQGGSGFPFKSGYKYAWFAVGWPGEE